MQLLLKRAVITSALFGFVGGVLSAGGERSYTPSKYQMELDQKSPSGRVKSAERKNGGASAQPKANAVLEPPSQVPEQPKVRPGKPNPAAPKSN